MKKFYNIAASKDNLRVWYFRNGLKLSIPTSLKVKNCDLYDSKAAVKQLVNVKLKDFNKPFCWHK